MEKFNAFSSNQIIITKRQLSMIMASMLLFCLFVFIIGFFLGKRTVIEDFSSKISKDALHDQIDFLLTTQSLQSAQKESSTYDSTLIDQNPTASIIEDHKDGYDELISSDVKALHEALSVPAEQNVIPIKKDTAVEQKQVRAVQGSQDVKLYAQLIGFGTKKAAQAFVVRLKKHNVPVILKTIISKTSTGKQRVWYQAITSTYESMEELQEQISKVKRLEHIRDKDIKIVYAK